MSPILYCFMAFTGGLGLFLILQKRRSASTLPPGPPRDPLVWHLLRMPSTNPALVFHQWAKTYGVSLLPQVLGRTMIILDSFQAAMDLLEKRGAIYSDRLKFTLYELTFSSPYRKNTENAWGGIISQIVAGHRITCNDDPYLRISSMILAARSKAGLPGSSPLDFFPIREDGIVRHFAPWFPGASHVGVCEEIKDVGAVSIFCLAMILHPKYQVTAQNEIDAVVGDPRLPNFEDRENLPLVECILQETLRWYPGVPLGRRSYDIRVVPSSNGRFVEGIPHRVREDDIYRGMLIPKDSLVFANIRRASIARFALGIFNFPRGMSFDESVYSDPISFYPERFLPKPAGKGEPYFNNAVFGFGRRPHVYRWTCQSSKGHTMHHLYSISGRQSSHCGDTARLAENPSPSGEEIELDTFNLDVAVEYAASVPDIESVRAAIVLQKARASARSTDDGVRVARLSHIQSADCQWTGTRWKTTYPRLIPGRWM
ncbi:cytochrome P450 [Mycena capillaripes]|nr:cytochrome P450 [Mycena capillaripes]